MSIVPFLFLAPRDASLFVDRWKPQIVADRVISLTGVNAYARARIQLQSSECVGMLANSRNAAFVIHKVNGTYELASCLWPYGTPSLQEFRDLREWCECMAPDVTLGRSRLDDGTERDLWDLSVFDV